MKSVPRIGDVIPLITGDATVIDIKEENRIIVLASRRHSHHPYATWAWGHEIGLHSGHYFNTLSEARTDYEERR